GVELFRRVSRVRVAERPVAAASHREVPREMAIRAGRVEFQLVAELIEHLGGKRRVRVERAIDLTTELYERRVRRDVGGGGQAGNDNRLMPGHAVVGLLVENLELHRVAAGLQELDASLIQRGIEDRGGRQIPDRRASPRVFERVILRAGAAGNVRREFLESRIVVLTLLN